MMAEFQVRLNQLEAEIARDNRVVVEARARINAREDELVSLRQQILVSRQLEDGTSCSDLFPQTES